MEGTRANRPQVTRLRRLILWALLVSAALAASPAPDLTLIAPIAMTGNPAAVEAALQEGADPNVSWGPGLTPLVLALSTNEASKVSLLRRAGAREPDRNGFFVLSLMRGDLAGTKKGIQQGADPNARYFFFGSPLKIATSRNHGALVALLLNYRVDLDRVDETNMNCLMHAASRGNVQITRLLLGKRANPNQKNAAGSTALHMVTRNGHAELVQMLLKHGGNPNLPDGNGQTPLIIAADWGAADVVRILIAGRANVNLTDRQKRSALLSVFGGRADSTARNRIVKDLVAAGANVNLRDPGSGRSALASSVGYADVDLMRFLIRHGADVNSKDDRGCSILFRARLGNPNPEVVSLLEKSGAVAVSCSP